MKAWRIVEEVHMIVRAPTAAEALVRWVEGGTPVAESVDVVEREVQDLHGRVQIVQDEPDPQG